MMAPVGMAMLFRVFPPAERVRAASILTIPTTMAPALGPVLGGLLVTSLTWRWVFFVNLPLGIAAIIFGALFLERMGTSDAGRFDLPGFVLGGAGLGLLMYGISEGPLKSWSSPEVIASCVVGSVLLVVFVFVELRTTRPMVDLRLLSGRLFRSTNAGDVPRRGRVLGHPVPHPPLLPGCPRAVGAPIGPLDLPRGDRRDDRRPIRQPDHLPPHRSTPPCHRRFVGLAVCMFGLTHVGLHHEPVAHPGPHVRARVDDGAGHGAQPGRSFAMITTDSMGRASTFFNTMRQVGSAVGVAILSTVLIRVGSASGSGAMAEPDLSAYHAAFYAAMVFALGAALCSLTIHDADAAETIVRRGRAARTQPAQPRPAVQPEPCRDHGLRLLRIEPGKRPGIRHGGGAVRPGPGPRHAALVYGGASVGLMGAVADAVMAGGGRATGVITEALAGHEIAHATLSDLLIVTTMHERKAKMSDLSDAFVMLPGGFGTYEEFMESVTWAQLGIHDKRCAVLNVDGFFDHLLAFLDHAVNCGFIKARQLSRVLVFNEVDALLDAVVPV